MITKQKYIEYLISTPINYTCSNLSEHLEDVSHDVVSHDVVSNFLKRNRITARQVWELVKGLIKNIPSGFLIIDDSVQNKQYSKSIGRVKKQYSGAVGGLVRGIGVVNLVHSDGKEHYPASTTGFMTTPSTARPRTTISRTCSLTPSLTRASWRKPCCSIVGMPLGRT